jgi:hypothetical protein
LPNILHFAFILLALSVRIPSTRADYPDANPPRETPILFAPGSISTGLSERDAAFIRESRDE